MFTDDSFEKKSMMAESFASDYEDAYDEMLNEMGAAVLSQYSVSRMLRETDPIAYDVGMRDYESSLLADHQYDSDMYSEMFDEDEELTSEGEKMLKEMYDEMLDESGVESLLNNYDASRLLKETDPIAYRVGLSDYESSMEEEFEAETFGAEKLHPGLYRYKGKIGLRKGWTECQECDDLVKQDEINFAYLEGYGNATVCDACVEKYQGFQRMDDYMRKNWTSWKDWGEKKEYSKKYVPVKKRYEWGESEIGRLVHDGIVKSPYGAETFGADYSLYDRKTKQKVGVKSGYHDYKDAYDDWEEEIVKKYPNRVSENEWIVIDTHSAETFGAESSGLTRLPSDEPNFDPQKADRNKDGKISSWERTVGNKVAKGIREGRKTSSKGIDTFAEPFEDIGISKPYARLGVIAAGITALAFGVKKLRK